MAGNTSNYLIHAGSTSILTANCLHLCIVFAKFICCLLINFFMPLNNINKRTLSQTSPELSQSSSKKASHLQSEAQPEQLLDMADSDIELDSAFSWRRFCRILDKKLENVARKADLDVVQQEVIKLRSENSKLNEEITLLKNRMETMERNSRRGRIIVRGLQSTNVDKAADEFSKLCLNLLKIRTKVIDIVKLNNKNSFAITIESASQTFSILSQKNKLKNSAVYMDQDLTLNERNARYKLRVLGRDLKPFPDIKVRLGGPNIYIDDIKYTWSDDKIVAVNEEDAEALQIKLKNAKLQYSIAVKPQRPRKVQQESAENSK